MFDSRRNIWECDECSARYQKQEHLDKHHLTCEMHQGTLAEQRKAPPPPPTPLPDEPYGRATAKKKAA